MANETTRPGDCDCGISLQAAGDLLCVYCQLAAVTGERDNYLAVLFGAGYENLEKMGAESRDCTQIGIAARERTQKIIANRAHYLTLLREIEAQLKISTGSTLRFNLTNIISRIPAEPAPCQGVPTDGELYERFSGNGPRGCQGCEKLSAKILENFGHWCRANGALSCVAHHVRHPVSQDAWDKIRSTLDDWAKKEKLECPTCAELKAGIVERDFIKFEAIEYLQRYRHIKIQKNLVDNTLEILARRPATDKPEGG